MAMQTQTFRLYQLMKDGQPHEVQKIADYLKIRYYSVSVYIHEMKTAFKAEIKQVRDGRKVTGYQLLNASKIKVPEFRKNSYGEEVKPAIKSIASIADELDSVNSGTVSEKEFADIRSSLGLDTAGFGGRNNGGWD